MRCGVGCNDKMTGDILMYIAIGIINKLRSGGSWVAQSVELPTTLAQVMISHSVSSSPASGPVLTAQSLEPALDSVSPSLSAPPPLMLCLQNK